MDQLLSLFFSFVDFTGGVALTLAVFRMNPWKLWRHILLSAFFLAQASFLLREVAELESSAILIQIILNVFVYKFFFKKQWFHAGLLGIIGYILVVILQMAIMFASTVLFPYTFQEVVNNDPPTIGYTVLTVYFAFCIIIAILLTRYRLGFLLIPETDREKNQLNTTTILVLLFLSLAVVILVTLYNITMQKQLDFSMLIIIMVVHISVLLYLALKKEENKIP